MKISVILFLIVLPLFAFGQMSFERKLIIFDSIFYGITIQNQVGQCIIGKYDQPIDSAQIFALPAGRKERQFPLPLSWALFNDTIYAINFNEYAQNTRLNSFKSIAVGDLEIFNENQSNTKQLMQGAYANSRIENWPLINAIKKYIYIDKLFFDIAVSDNDMIQCIAVNNELTIWSNIGGVWQIEYTGIINANSFFNCFILEEKRYLIENNGAIFLIENELVKVGQTQNLSETTIIQNLNTNQLYSIRNSVLHSHLTLEKICNDYAIRIELPN